MERVAIIGAAQTKFEKNKPDTFAELVYDVTSRALADAGITIKEVDNVVSISSDFWDGRTISSMAISDAAGAFGKDITTVEGDGTFGALYGMMRILSGSFGCSVVVAHHKGSESSMNGITNTSFDPLVERRLGLDGISSAALQARRYMSRWGIWEEQLAAVSVKNHGNARRNPLAQLPLDISIDDVLDSRKIADPLKLLDCSPVSDGATCLILAAERHAKKWTTNKKRVWLKGVGHCTDAFRLGDRDLADTRALKAAAKKAYAHGRHRGPGERDRRGRGLRRLLLHGADVAGGPGHRRRRHGRRSSWSVVSPTSQASSRSTPPAGASPPTRYRWRASRPWPSACCRSAARRKSARWTGWRPPWCTASTASAVRVTASGYWVSRGGVIWENE